QALSPEMAPVDIYKRAVAAMHAMHAPAYVQFDTRVRTTIREGNELVIVQHLKHVERTNDQNVVARDVDEPIDHRVNPFDIAPDLFFEHAVKAKPASSSDTLSSGLDDLADKSLKTIGVVRVTYVHYKVRTAGTEDLPSCASAIHLQLEPVGDPLIYNLRDLWVEPATSRICKAVAVWRGHIYWKNVIAPITLDLDEHGLITHWITTLRTRLLAAVIISEEEASYENLQPVEESVWTAFNSEQRASKEKH
ncbi:MAG TPA: hypothetical protein VGT98_07255, partial [Candidatus Elarobacter sp.]|nr:hypothetical protein [Candidatus Elarobacter sp.]